MNLLDRLKPLAEAIFNYRFEVRNLKERQDEDRKELRELAREINRVAATVYVVSERVTRLEAARDADHAQAQADRAQSLAERAQLAAERAQLQTETTRFQLEVERVIVRMNAARTLPPGSVGEIEPRRD